MLMRTDLVLLAFATLVVTGCSDSGTECVTNACFKGDSIGYAICQQVNHTSDTTNGNTSPTNTASFSVTYKFNGKTCSCSGYYTGGCTSCQEQITAYCGVAPDLAVPQDLSTPRDDLSTED